MKKVSVLVVIALLLVLPLVLQLVLAQDAPPGLPPGIGQDPEEIVGGAREKIETKWDYLSQEWQKILLQNKFMHGLNTFCTKINFVFRILFGQPYSLTLTLLVVIILWILLAFQGAKIIRSYGLVGGGPSYIVGIAFAVIIAQLQILRIIVDAVGRLIFAREAAWARFALGAVSFLVIIFIYGISEFLAKYLKEKKKKKREQKTVIAQTAIQKWFQRFSEIQE